MSIFHRKAHSNENSGEKSKPLESIDTNMLPTDELRVARREQLSSHASDSGVIRPYEAQRAQDEAISQVSGDHEALMSAGRAAEEAGRAAMMGAGIPEQSIDANHQLNA